MPGRERAIEQTLVGPIRVQAIFRAQLEAGAPAGGKFALIRHANGCVHLGAQAAENALAEVERGGARGVLVEELDGCGRTDGGRGARVLPVRPINFRLAASAAGHFRRRLRIARCDDAGLQTLAKGFKHKSISTT